MRTEQAHLWYTPYALSWDDKAIGATVLLAQLTGASLYRDVATSYLADWMPGGSLPYTPKGLVFRSQWGSLRYAMNSAFVAVVYADRVCSVPGMVHWLSCVLVRRRVC